MNTYTPPKDLLAGRTILVTGAGDGIGRTAAETFGKYGATVILLGHNIPKLEKVYDAIDDAGGPQPAIYPMNLESAKDTDCYKLFETVEKEFGSLEGILHNAAQLPALAQVDDYDLQAYYKVMQVNLNAPFMLTQACMPLLRKAKDASVIFTSDSVGHKAKAYWGAYAISKFGIEGFMQVLADETRDNTNIRVNSINPGPTRTLLRSGAYPGEDPNTVKPPEALMPLYLWLMGQDSIGTHGESIEAEEWVVPQ